MRKQLITQRKQAKILFKDMSSFLQIEYDLMGFGKQSFQ